MTYRVTSRAEQDLAEIGDYIARDNRRKAVQFVDKIEAQFAKIAAQPALYRKREDLLPGLRATSMGRYMIFFRCEENGDVVFLRVLHSARDQKEHLRGER